MKIRRLSIRNYRGIRELDWILPERNLFCLIGRGDSAKTTILEAIRSIFSPQWNLTFSDTDFHNCIPGEIIEIEAVFGELADELCSEAKYGRHLRGWNSARKVLHDEPEDGDENVLTACLTVDRNLEPKWKIITDREPAGVEFKTGDRAKLGVGFIGSYSERQLSWATGTALAKITEASDLNESLVEATRSARNSLDGNRDALQNFDAAAAKSEQVAKDLGIPVASSYKSHLDLSAISVRIGGLSLHDGNIPVRQLGLGSRRMLLCGIQKESLQTNHITLIDEIESGLEPHRICRLLKHIKEDGGGQYFITTHSPTVLKEFTTEDLHIIHRGATDVAVISTSDETLAGHNIQGYLRSSSEAFLAKKIVICEGATEVGFLRGYDDYRKNHGLRTFAYLGVAPLDAGGASKIKSLAKAFKAMAYDVYVIADGDNQTDFSNADSQELIESHIPVIMWADHLCLEKRAFTDLPWAQVLASLSLADETFPVHDNVKSRYGGDLDTDFLNWQDSTALRAAIGEASTAKKSSWFKSVTRGERWFLTISPAFDDGEFSIGEIVKKLELFSNWIEE